MKFNPVKLVNKAFLSVLMLLGVCLALTGTSMAVNHYYVNGVAGSDSNDGSQARPWKTIQKADSSLSLGSDGTVVHVAPGTYRGPITTSKSGTPSARIVFISDTKWGAKVTTANWQTNGSYVDVNGFDMTSPSTGNSFGMLILSNSVHVLNNYFHDFDLGGCAFFGVINISSGGVSTVYFDTWVIGNVIRRISTYSLGTTSCITAHGIYDIGARSIIQNNILSAITGPAILKKMAPGQTGTNGVNIISGNTVFNNGGGIQITENFDSPGPNFGANTVWDYNVINNNIVVNNGVDTPTGGSYGIDYYHVTGTHNLVTNNLVYGNKPSDYSHHLVACAGGTPISGSDGNGTSGGCPSANPKSDPSVSATFVNFQVDTPSSPASSYDPRNYQIKAGSSAIQNGTTGCASSPGMSPCVPAVDFLGVARPASNLDIGAFEQGGDTVAGVPSAPTGLTAAVQ